MEGTLGELTNSATSFDDPIVLQISPRIRIFSDQFTGNSPFKDNL